MPDYEFTQYRRKQIAELRPYIEGEDVSHVSISPEDAKAGSPRVGDMIARNPKNHNDQWLVARAYFLDNFEPLTAEQAEPAPAAEAAACVERGSEQSTPQPESRLREARLREALESIANNMCCSGCQEAALVARAALKETSDERAGFVILSRAEVDAIRDKALEEAAEIAQYIPTPVDVQDHALRLGYISASQAIATVIRELKGGRI